MPVTVPIEDVDVDGARLHRDLLLRVHVQNQRAGDGAARDLQRDAVGLGHRQRGAEAAFLVGERDAGVEHVADGDVRLAGGAKCIGSLALALTS